MVYEDQVGYILVTGIFEYAHVCVVNGEIQIVSHS